VMIRREVYEKFGYQDKRFVSLSDFDLWVKLLFGHRLWILDQQLTMFRVRDNGMNLSANNTANRRRQQFEFKQILDHYLQVRDPEQLKKIFPECAKYGNPVDQTIPYFLGMLAIDFPSMLHRLWGLETIFDLMADAETARLLEEVYDFRYRDFIELTKTAPLFSETMSASSNMFAIKQRIAQLFPRLYNTLKRLYFKTTRRS